MKGINMRLFIYMTVTTIALIACAGKQHTQSTSEGVNSEPVAVSEGVNSKPVAVSEDMDQSPTPEKHTFQTLDSHTAVDSHGVKKSTIKPTTTEAAIKFFVVDKDKGPIKGIVISLTGPNGKKYYTKETDAVGYSELLVPLGQTYDLVYLSLGRRKIAASVPVSNEPSQTIKLTLRYKGYIPSAKEPAPRLVLKGILFDTGKATIKAKSFPRLDSVVEYMTHKKSARIEISGHTDNVGQPKANKKLSQNRANACRDYLISKGINGSRIQAVGYGDERPIASNNTPKGRQKNRRIEAKEL